MADNSERTALLQEAGDSDAFTICDQHLTVLDVDESALRYLGGKPNRADVIGQNLADLTDRERCDRYLRVMETGERFVAEESLLLPDGEKACVVTRAFKVGDHLAILISDVTAERLAQAVARELGVCRVAVESASDVIWVSDIHLNTAYVSPSVQAALGFTQDERMEQDPAEQMTPESVARMDAALDEYLAREADPSADPRRTLRIELEYYRQDGSTVWMENHITCLRDAEGKATGFHGIARDITAQRRDRALLADSEGTYRKLFDQAVAGMAVLEEDTGQVVLGNNAMAGMFGFRSAEDLGGVNALGFVLPEQREWVGTRMADLLLDPASRQTVTMGVKTQDGRDLTVTGSGTSLEHEGRAAILISVIDTTAAHDADLKLQESEEKYRRLVENTDQGILVVQGGAIVFGNRAAALLTGYDAADLQSRPLSALVHPEDLETVREHLLTRARGEDGASACPARVLDRDGGTRWAEIGAMPISWEGKPAVMALITDVTERRAVRQALEASEAKYRDLFEHTLLGMEVVDVQTGRVILANRSMARMFGAGSPADLIGIDPLEWVMPEDREWVINDMARLPSHPSWDKVATIRFKNLGGGLTWVTAMTTSFEYEGRPAMLVSLIDVTRAREAEIRLHEREEQYRLLVENATEAIGVLQDGRIVYVNSRLSRASGYSAEELLGKPSFLDVLHPDDREIIGDHYARGMAGEEAPSTYQFRFLTKDGGTGWVEANVAPVSWGGKPAALCLMAIITERKRAQQELERRERYFRALLETSSEGILVMDREGQVQYASPGAMRLLETDSERLGESVLAPIHPDDLPAAGEALQRCAATGQTLVAELRARHRDGGWRLIEARVNNLLEDPAVNGLLVNMRDVTERRKARRALEESEAKYRRVFENTQVGMEIISAEDFRVLEANEAAARMFGFSSPAECVGLDFRDYVEPGIGEKAARAMAGALEDRGAATQPGEARARTVDGRWIWVSGMVIETQYEGNPALLCTIVDVTGRRQAEETLRASEERNRVVVENANEVITVLQDGLIRFANRRFSTVTGYAAEEYLVRPFLDFIHPDDREMVLGYYRRRISGEEAPATYQFRFLNKAGDVGWAEANASLIDWEGRRATLVSMGIITERKRMGEQILKAQAELEARVEQRTAELKEANSLLIEEIGHRQRAQKKLQESEARYRELVENANSIILELDERGRVTFFNRFAEEFYGFKEAEIIGRHVVGTIAPPVDSSGKDMKAEIKSIVKHPEEHFVTENEGMRRNGERVWISWTNKGLLDEEGRLRKVLCIGMDRTEQRRVADMLSEQLKEKAAAAERQRLARDLHDAVTQTLFSASLIAEVLPRLWSRDRAEARRRLEELRRLTRGALAEMRMLLLELRPGALGEVGLVELLRQLVEATTAQTAMGLTLKFRGKCGVPPEVQVALYRVAQEALNNVVKHSGATEAQVRLSCRVGAADLSVSDNGSGFDPQGVSPRSLGLRIMHERIEAVGATLTIEASKDHGTRVRAVWSDGGRKGAS